MGARMRYHILLWLSSHSSSSSSVSSMFFIIIIIISGVLVPWLLNPSLQFYSSSHVLLHKVCFVL